jgi:hypothetical protein
VRSANRFGCGVAAAVEAVSNRTRPNVYSDDMHQIMPGDAAAGKDWQPPTSHPHHPLVSARPPRGAPRTTPPFSRTAPVTGLRSNGTGFHALVGARVVTGPG